MGGVERSMNESDKRVREKTKEEGTERGGVTVWLGHDVRCNTQRTRWRVFKRDSGKKNGSSSRKKRQKKSGKRKRTGGAGLYPRVLEIGFSRASKFVGLN